MQQGEGLMEVILLVLGTAYGILLLRSLELYHKRCKAFKVLKHFVREAQNGLLDFRPDVLEDIYKEAREVLGEND